MNVEILQENLIKAVQLTSRFVQNKTSIPIMQNLLLEATQGKLQLSASNMETAISMYIPAKVNTPGKAAVPAKLFVGYLNLLKPGKLLLDKEGEELKLLRPDHNASLSGSSPEDFPLPAKIEEEVTFTLTKKQIEDIVSFVCFTASTEEARPVLSALLLLFKDKGFEVVATDGYRLSLLAQKNETMTEKMGKILVPAKVILEIDKVCKDFNIENMEVVYSSKQKSLVFKWPEGQIQTRLIEGEFPPYEKIIPTESLYQVSLSKQEMIEAVRAASLFAQKSGNIIKCRVGDKGVSLSANATNVGKQESFVNAAVVSKGEDLVVAFNSRYLLDILSHLSQDEVIINLNEPLKPVVFSQQKTAYKHIIMPVRTQES